MSESSTDPTTEEARLNGADSHEGEDENGSASKVVPKRNKLAERMTAELEPDALDILDVVAEELVKRGLVNPRKITQTLLLKALIYSHPLWRCDYESGLAKLAEAEQRSKKAKAKARKSKRSSD